MCFSAGPGLGALSLCARAEARRPPPPPPPPPPPSFAVSRRWRQCRARGLWPRVTHPLGAVDASVTEAAVNPSILLVVLQLARTYGGGRSCGMPWKPRCGLAARTRPPCGISLTATLVAARRSRPRCRWGRNGATTNRPAPSVAAYTTLLSPAGVPMSATPTRVAMGPDPRALQSCGTCRPSAACGQLADQAVRRGTAPRYL